MRGQGRVFRPIVAGKAMSKWWLDYSSHGVRHREPAGTSSKAEALRLLRERMTAREAGKVVGRPDRVRLAEYQTEADGSKKLVGGLRALVERQYVLDGRRSINRLRPGFANLERLMGAETRAPELNPARLDTYVEARMKEGASRATVNYELALVRRALRLGVEKGLLAVVPLIRLPAVRNARTGFFEDGAFAALLLELPDDLRGLVTFLRMTGWRKSEVQGLQWAQVDQEAEVIRLNSADTKGGEARIFPYGVAAELKALLGSRWAKRDGLFVFHIRGERVSDGALRSSWKRACKRAGLEGRLVHDLRRSAARDFRRAGVTEGEIMKLCGWRTRSMFDRYNIIDEQDLARAAAKRFNGKVAAKSAPAGTAADSLSSFPA